MKDLQSSINNLLVSNKRVEALAKMIEEIGIKTKMIDDIVFQTRLLSFNASVEAERAGEHGRGFAVVAQEVGNLALMSGKSSNEISLILKNSIKEAQDVVKLNNTYVSAGVELCKLTATELSTVQKIAEEILSAEQGFLRALEEQKIGVQQVNQSIGFINENTQQYVVTTKNFSENIRKLIHQGDNLNHSISDLKLMISGFKKEKTEAAPVVRSSEKSIRTQGQRAA